MRRAALIVCVAVGCAPGSSAEPADAAPSASASASSYAWLRGPEVPLVVLRGQHVYFGGSRVATLPTERVQRVDAVFDPLKEQRERWRTARPGKPFPGVVSLEIGDGTTCIAAFSVLQTFAYAGYPNVLLRSDDTEIFVSWFLPAQPHLGPEPKRHPSGLRLAHLSIGPSGSLDLFAERCLAPFESGTVVAAGPLVREWCRGTRCLGAALFACREEVPFRQTWAAMASVLATFPELPVGMTRTCSATPREPRPLGAPPKAVPKGEPQARRGALASEGALPEEVARRAIDGKIREVRDCFAAHVEFGHPVEERTMRLRIEVAKSGRVTAIDELLGPRDGDELTVGCAESAFASLDFPPRAGPSWITVDVVLALK